MTTSRPRRTASSEAPSTAWTFLPGEESSTEALAGKTSVAETDEPPKPLSIPWTVSQLNTRARVLLERQFDDVLVQGEVSGSKQATSGHFYFSLKDASSVVSAVLWGRDAARHKLLPKDGDQVEVSGRLTLYEPRGQFQLVATSVRPAGVGALHLKFLKLKDRLEADGLFDPTKKRPIPALPRVVGIVTSPTGAALRDIISVLDRRAPGIQIIVWPARVQGEGSAQEIAAGIRKLAALGIAEVLIVGRGGGAYEDLWSFNEEIVARAIAACPVPVISAVGHEIDFTIADFVADLRAPTPSAAAEIVARSSTELLRELQHVSARMESAIQRRLQPLRAAATMDRRLAAALHPRIRLGWTLVRQFERSPVVRRPFDRVERARQYLDDWTSRATKALESALAARRAALLKLDAQLSALSPKAVLGRGYSITLVAASGTAVRAPEDAPAGTELRIITAGGDLSAVAATSGESPVVSPPPPKAKKRSTHPPSAPDEDFFGAS